MKCSMGVGCEEYGVCFAAAHGQPDRCPLEDNMNTLTPPRELLEKKCCTPTEEELRLLQAGEYTPEELRGGREPSCPKCWREKHKALREAADRVISINGEAHWREL